MLFISSGYLFVLLILMITSCFILYFPQESKLIVYGISSCPQVNCDNNFVNNVTIYLDNYDRVNYPYNVYDEYERTSPFCELPNGAKCLTNHNNVLSDARFFVACKRHNEILAKHMPRYCMEQLVIQFNHEPEMYDCNLDIMNEHDITVNYKLTSDVPLPYICGYLDKLIEVAKKPTPTTKTKGVALFLSKCNKDKGRLDFIRELMKYIQVDSYGKCFHNTDMPVSRQEKDWQGIKQNISSHYRFLISVEGAILPGFVTEKIWHAYLVQAIPIYRGTPEVFDQVPGSNTFLFVDNFTSPKALAEYIKQVDSDQQLYESFFKMDLTNYYEIKEKYCTASRICAICTEAYKRKVASKKTRCKFV